MKCPHCAVEIHAAFELVPFTTDRIGRWLIKHCICPACNSTIVYLNVEYGSLGLLETKQHLVYPKGTNRPPLLAVIPPQYAADYNEAALVLSDSPKASAALSRRCLQQLLRDQLKVKHGNLADEIQQVLDAHRLPSHLEESIDAVRNIGNFAAHPIKNTNTGQIVDVEPGEAEWLLDVLDGMFDFLFVQPAATKAKRQALNAKLAQTKKPPMK